MPKVLSLMPAHALLAALATGLTIPFALGEWVDYKARALHETADDPRLLPAAYLPLAPVEALVAALSQPARLPSASPPAPPAPLSPLPVAQAEDRVTTAAAAPAPRHSGWEIHGEVLESTESNGASGEHYEICLYSAIGPTGLPEGFPLVQRILPTGERAFTLKMPGSVARGYLFGELVATNGHRTWLAPRENPWSPQREEAAELVPLAALASSAEPASAPAAETPGEASWILRGRVVNLFSPEKARLAEGGVSVKVRGTRLFTTTANDGTFSLELPRARGTLELELEKAGYLALVAPVRAGEERPLEFRVAARDSIMQLALKAGVRQQDSLGAALFVLRDSNGAPLPGAAFRMSARADGPFYFDRNGGLTLSAADGADGRVVFFNVEPGPGMAEADLEGETLVPLSLASVPGGELLLKTLVPERKDVSGRILSAVAGGGVEAGPLAGARVRIAGTSEWASTDATGAFHFGPLRGFRGEEVVLELTASHFRNHRYLWREGQASSDLYAFPDEYLAKLGRSMGVEPSDEAGTVVGRLRESALRMDALADSGTGTNGARDFYFDAQGKMHGAGGRTDPHFGSYMIFDVPPGRVLLEGFDPDGRLRYSNRIEAGQGVVNVEVEP